MVGALAGLQDHLKLAREYALEGLYDTAIIFFFDGAIAHINKNLSTLDDAAIRSKWMNCKKAISEEVDIVKQLDAELRAFKELPGSRRSSSPRIPAKSFVFQPLDEYPDLVRCATGRSRCLEAAEPGHRVGGDEEIVSRRDVGSGGRLGPALALARLLAQPSQVPLEVDGRPPLLAWERKRGNLLARQIHRVVMQRKGSRRKVNTKALMQTWLRCWRGMSWRRALGSGGMMFDTPLERGKRIVVTFRAGGWLQEKKNRVQREKKERKETWRRRRKEIQIQYSDIC